MDFVYLMEKLAKKFEKEKAIKIMGKDKNILVFKENKKIFVINQNGVIKPTNGHYNEIFFALFDVVSLTRAEMINAKN